MIDDLDRSLEALLRASLPPSLVEQITVSFATPDDQFPPAHVTLPAIDLFLYDVRENRELRSNEWMIERRANGTARSSPPLVRVDCSYLISGWPSESTPQPALDEHHLLGEVMRTLLRYPTLPAAVLKGVLASQELPPPTALLQPGRLQSVGEFWQALGGKPKAVLNYTVTISVSPFEPVEAPLVLENIVRAPDARPPDQAPERNMDLPAGVAAEGTPAKRSARQRPSRQGAARQSAARTSATDRRKADDGGKP